MPEPGARQPAEPPRPWLGVAVAVVVAGAVAVVAWPRSGAQPGSPAVAATRDPAGAPVPARAIDAGAPRPMTPEPARPRGPAPAEPDKPRNVTRRGPESVEVLLELDPALSIDERRRICREHDIVMIELPAPDGKPTYVYQSDSVSMTPAAIEKLRATPGVRAVQTRVVPEEQR